MIVCARFHEILIAGYFLNGLSEISLKKWSKRMFKSKNETIVTIKICMKTSIATPHNTSL